MSRIKSVNNGLLEIFCVGLLPQIGQIYTVEKCLVPEVGLVGDFLGQQILDCSRTIGNNLYSLTLVKLTISLYLEESLVGEGSEVKSPLSGEHSPIFLQPLPCMYVCL